MSVGTLVRNNVMGKLTLIDGSPIPVVLALAFDMGDFEVTGLKGPMLNEHVVFSRRGRHVSAAPGERVYPELKASAFLTDASDAATPGTALDFLLKRRAYADNVSVAGDGRPYSVTLKWEILAAAYGGTDEVFVFPDCLPDFGIGEGADGNKLTMSFKMCGEPTLDGLALASQAAD